MIVKIGDNKYLLWSGIVDAPTTNILTREAMRDYLIEVEFQDPAAVEKRLERADLYGTSSMNGRTIGDIVNYNRAGPNETHLSLEEIIERYTLPQKGQ